MDVSEIRDPLPWQLNTDESRHKRLRMHPRTWVASIHGEYYPNFWPTESTEQTGRKTTGPRGEPTPGNWLCSRSEPGDLITSETHGGDARSPLAQQRLGPRLEPAFVFPISLSRRNPPQTSIATPELYNGRLFGNSHSYSVNYLIEPLSPHTHHPHTPHPTNQQGTLIYHQMFPPNAAQPSKALPHSNPQPPVSTDNKMYTSRSEQVLTKKRTGKEETPHSIQCRMK